MYNPSVELILKEMNGDDAKPVVREDYSVVGDFSLLSENLHGSGITLVESLAMSILENRDDVFSISGMLGEQQVDFLVEDDPMPEPVVEMGNGYYLILSEDETTYHLVSDKSHIFTEGLIAAGLISEDYPVTTTNQNQPVANVDNTITPERYNPDGNQQVQQKRPTILSGAVDFFRNMGKRLKEWFANKTKGSGKAFNRLARLYREDPERAQRLAQRIENKQQGEGRSGLGAKLINNIAAFNKTREKIKVAANEMRGGNVSQGAKNFLSNLYQRNVQARQAVNQGADPDQAYRQAMSGVGKMANRDMQEIQPEQQGQQQGQQPLQDTGITYQNQENPQQVQVPDQSADGGQGQQQQGQQQGPDNAKRKQMRQEVAPSRGNQNVQSAMAGKYQLSGSGHMQVGVGPDNKPQFKKVPINMNVGGKGLVQQLMSILGGGTLRAQSTGEDGKRTDHGHVTPSKITITGDGGRKVHLIIPKFAHGGQAEAGGHVVTQDQGARGQVPAQQRLQAARRDAQPGQSPVDLARQRGQQGAQGHGAER